jgi:hypothetical protein
MLARGCKHGIPLAQGGGPAAGGFPGCKKNRLRLLKFHGVFLMFLSCEKRAVAFIVAP